MKPLTGKYGITEVLHGSGDYYHEAWWWCRHHRRPELGSWAMMNCTRIGPLQSEDEAQAVGKGLGEAR